MTKIPSYHRTTAAAVWTLCSTWDLSKVQQILHIDWL